MLLTKSDIVSSESEELILVNAADEPIGSLGKSACHDGSGVLHRAFSLFVFNRRGELLIQQRDESKRLWPGFWANSCCSHPRVGESMQVAAARRLEQELGLTANLEFIYKFEYSATFRGEGTEHELCSVFVGHTDTDPIINTTEIMAWRWIAPATLDREVRAEAEKFTPWVQLEWERLRNDFPEALGRK